MFNLTSHQILFLLSVLEKVSTDKQASVDGGVGETRSSPDA